MDTRDELLEQALALGRALAQHPTVRAYWAAQAGVQQDADARHLLAEYTATLEDRRRLALQKRTPDDALKQRIRRAEEHIASNDVLKRWMRAQADYIELMQRVNSAMESPLIEERQQRHA